MGDEKIAFERFNPGRPPAVVLGDLSLVRPIAMAKIPVILATSEADDLALRSRVLAGHRVVSTFVEPEGRARCAEELVDLGRRLQRRLGRKVPLFYNSDKHLELLYQHRAALSDAFLMVLNDEDVAWALHDKERFYALTERAGVRAPKTLQAGDDIERARGTLKGAVLVKPKRKNAWNEIKRDLFDGEGKARVFATMDELLSHPHFARFKDELIVQEYLDGAVSSLVSFHGFIDPNGKVLASYAGRKIRTHPSFAGESCFIELVHAPDVEAEGRNVVKRLGLKGPFKIDFLRDERTGTFYTLEINARFNLWNHLGAADGINLPAIAYDYLVDGRAPREEPRYTARHRWVNFYRDFQAYKELHERGELRLGNWLGSLASPRVVHETFAWNDPAPFLLWAGDYVRGKLVRSSKRG